MKKRLSKLQKWILEHCYFVENGKEIIAMKKRDIFYYFKQTFTIGSQTFPITGNFKGFFTPQEYNKINATISRSIRGLRNNGYIKLIGHEKRQVFNFEAISAEVKGLTKEQYLEKHKNQSPEELMKNFSNWYKTQDVVIEIKDSGTTSKVKALELTDRGIEKAKELLKLSSERI